MATFKNTPNRHTPCTTVHRFLSSRKASVAVVFSLMLTPVFGFAGVALDYNRMVNARTGLQAATDAAALASVRYTQGEAPIEEVKAHADRVFFASLSQQTASGVTETDLTPIDSGYRFEATSNVSTTLSKIIGASDVSVSASSDAVYGSSPIEVSIVIDTTNSTMFQAAQRAQAMSSIKAFAQKVLDESQGNSRVTFIPYQERIRLGARATAWTGGVAAPGGWGGCLDVRREYVNAAHANITAPNTNRQTPYGEYILTDRPPSELPFTYWNYSEFSTPYVNVNNAGGNRTVKCTSNAVLGPISAYDQSVSTYIDSFATASTGRFDDALAWGWRALSPRWAGLWNAEPNYPRPINEISKLLIWVTDGQSSMDEFEDNGYFHDNTYSHNQGSVRGWDQRAALCTRIKNAGIQIAVIRLSGAIQRVRDSLQACASDGLHYPIDNISNFVEAFDSLGSYSLNVRLVN